MYNKHDQWFFCLSYHDGKNGSYADHIAIEQLAQVLKIQIVVHQETGDHVLGSSGICRYPRWIPAPISHYVALNSVLSSKLSIYNRNNTMLFTTQHQKSNITLDVSLI